MRISDWSSDVCSSDLTQLELVVDLEEVGACAVHFVDEGQTGHPVFIGLAPYCFGLRLHAAHGAVHHAGTVEHTPGTFHLDREVNVTEPDERRVGKEGRRNVRTRWSPYH